MKSFRQTGDKGLKLEVNGLVLIKNIKLFQWVELKQDVPNSLVKKGDQGVVLDYLKPTKKQPEPGYTLEVFQNGETLEVISVPISWVVPLPEVWGQTQDDNINLSVEKNHSKVGNAHPTVNSL